jgi:dTDP-4-dehydrorhamnose 3,5-epimerase
MKLEKTNLSGLVIIHPDVHEDDRGFFMESYRKDKFAELGITDVFVQDNHSKSQKNVVRGLHFQWDQPMAKLMRVTAGRALCVAVDIRLKSPTLGMWHTIEISAKNKLQVYAPAGFARGFCALEDGTEVQYKCSALYNPKAESGIRWNDPDIGIEWPVTNPSLSEKDAKAQTLKEWLARPEAKLF